MGDYTYDGMLIGNITAFYDGKKYDKDKMLNYHIMHTLSKTNEMFEWDIPEKNITSRDLELRLQTKGFSIIAKYNDNLYSLNGNLGGRPNFNYMPSWAVVANPYLKLFKTYKINYGYDYGTDYPDLENLEECVVIPNDAMYVGLIPTLSMYLSRMVETDISRRVVTKTMRAMMILLAKDTDTQKSIQDVINSLDCGEISSILAEDVIHDSAVDSLPFAGSATAQRAITELIESEQYDKASLWNELGLQANYNMKREAINSDEAQLNEDAIIPFTDNMLKQRKLACERINNLFGTNWKVDFSSSWKYKREELEKSIKEEPNQLGNEKKTDKDNEVENDENTDN